MPEITKRDVGKFIKNELIDKLHDDLLNIKIIKESDLQCCIYYHLRNFLYQDASWKISTRIFIPHTGKFPDIILFKKGIPKIGVELKWNKKNRGKKDGKSLNKLLEIGVSKVYYINVIIDKKFERTEKNPLEKNRYFNVIINLGLQGEKLKKWKSDRAKYRKEMKKGTSKKFERILKNGTLIP